MSLVITPTTPFIGGPIVSGTTGSILFVDSGLFAQDNANFFWDNTNDILRVPQVIGNTASTNDLILRANSATFDDTNTGRIYVRDRVVFDSSWTGTGTAGVVDVAWLKTTGTLTTAIGVNLVKGLSHSSTVSFSVNQALSGSPGFLVDAIVQPTTSSTDTLTFWMGYNNTGKLQPSGSSITPVVTDFMGYSSSPKVYLGPTATSITVTNLTSYASYVFAEFLQNSLNSATISNLYHFRIGNLLQNSSTLTNNFGLYIPALNFGTNRYGVYSDIASSANHYFIYGNGTAQSVHLGKFKIGAVTAPAVDLDVVGAVAYGKATVSLTADNQAIVTANRSYISLSSNNGTASNRDFVLNQSTVAGHQLILEWTGTNAGQMIDNVAQGGGGNTRLSADWVPTEHDTIHLISNGTDWIELGRSTN